MIPIKSFFNWFNINSALSLLAIIISLFALFRDPWPPHYDWNKAPIDVLLQAKENIILQTDSGPSLRLRDDDEYQGIQFWQQNIENGTWIQEQIAELTSQGDLLLRGSVYEAIDDDFNY